MVAMVNMEVTVEMSWKQIYLTLEVSVQSGCFPCQPHTVHSSLSLRERGGGGRGEGRGRGKGSEGGRDC